MKTLTNYIKESSNSASDFNAFAVKKGDKLFLDKKEYKGWWMLIRFGSENVYKKKAKEWMNSTDYAPGAPLGNVKNGYVFYTDNVKHLHNLDFDDEFTTDEKGNVLNMLLYHGDKLADELFNNGKWVK